MASLSWRKPWLIAPALLNESELEYFIESGGRRLSPAIRVQLTLRHVVTSFRRASGHFKQRRLSGQLESVVYEIVGGRVVEPTLMKQVQANVTRTYPGGVSPEGPNFFSDAERGQFARDVNWVNVLACRGLHDPERLLVNAQVPPSSGYGANMSKSIVYIDVSRARTHSSQVFA